MSYSSKTIAGVLKQRGYKLTPQRRTIIDEIIATPEHQTPAAIYERVNIANPGIGLVTIYRTLEILEECGLICETHSGHSCHSYLMRHTAAHHHHLICSSCGKVVDFGDCSLTDLENKLMETSGFKINSHLLEFLGQCGDCASLELKPKKKEEVV